jgi:hypothetical protein
VRPVFEYAFVDALGLPQIGAAIEGDAGIEDVARSITWMVSICT